MKINRMVLVAAMAKNSMTSIMLSKKANVSKATLSAVKNGKTCTYNTAAKIAEALSLKVEDLIEV